MILLLHSPLISEAQEAHLLAQLIDSLLLFRHNQKFFFLHIFIFIFFFYFSSIKVTDRTRFSLGLKGYEISQFILFTHFFFSFYFWILLLLGDLLVSVDWKHQCRCYAHEEGDILRKQMSVYQDSFQTIRRRSPRESA